MQKWHSASWIGCNTLLFIMIAACNVPSMCAGVAALLKSVSRDITVVGCQPAASDVMRASVAAGRIVEQASANTLSDGSAGGVVGTLSCI